jgi:membrane protease YdiL (CAAX protease family)
MSEGTAARDVPPERGPPPEGVVLTPRFPPPAPPLPAWGSVPAPRSWPLVAWAVILALVVFNVVRFIRAPTGDNRSVQRVMGLIEGRVLVGAANLPGAPRGKLGKQFAGLLDKGPFEERLRLVPVCGELSGPAEASRRLYHLAEDWANSPGGPPSPASAELLRLLRKLYAGLEDDPKAVPLDEAERQQLRARLGWLGDLALAPPGGDDAEARERALAPAYRALAALLAQVALTLGGAVLGLGLLIVLLVLAVKGRLGGGLGPSGRGGLYAETFALYMLLFQGLGFAASYLPMGRTRLFAAGAIMLLSLAALAWPRLRGVPWRAVLHDVGLFRERRPLRTIACGLAGYLMALPFLVAALLFVRGLQRYQKYLGPPVHSILGLALRADFWTWALIVVLACVLAPVVEEIMFRGALYRHLRESTRPMPTWLSIAASAGLSGLVFAAVHPQGLLGVPVLMSLAIGFALIREWRRSLVPSMLAHALNNALATTLLLLATR